MKRMEKLDKTMSKSKEITYKVKKQIWKTVGFILLILLLAYYVIQGLPGNVRETVDGGNDLPAFVSQKSEDFFIEFKIAREKIQKEQMDLIKGLMEDPGITGKAKEEAQFHYLTLVDALGKELKIEGILKARGWDAIVFVSGDSCTVVIRTVRLSENEVSQIGEVVKKVAKIGLQNIAVIPTPP